ncbi:MAG: RecX family transcriptional regulator [Novosphingobium sp.]
MMQQSSHNRTPRQPPKPLGPARLEELALAYAARFAVSAAKLADYLRRKLRERGWEGEGEPPVEAIVVRFVTAGYVDDAAYARAKSASMLRRGLGMRRVSQAWQAAGIAEEHREEARASEGAQRRAALALARKRRIGPFGAVCQDRAGREKQIAVMLRGGHPLDSARELVNAASIEAAEQWAAQFDGDEPCA